MAEKADDRIHNIEKLIQRLEASPDSETRAVAFSLMQAVLELHGSGIERMIEIVFDSGEASKTTIRRLGSDPLVSSLLVLHDLHPDDLETRVQQVLNKLHDQAELLGAFEGVVRVRLLSSACGLKEAVEAALLNGVPDAAAVIVEDALPASTFVPLAALGMAIPGGI
jgi:hypothetical protein